MLARFGTSVGVVFLLILAPVDIQASDSLDAVKENLHEQGKDLCNDGKWAEALPIHERLTKLDPDYGFGWMGLGWSRQETGDCAGAISAYRRALDLGGMPEAVIHRHIAECLAATGRTPEALAELESAIDAGLTRLEQVSKSKAFAPLREDAALAPEFRALVGDIDVSGQTREQGWAGDLDLLKREVLRLHYDPFRKLTQEELDRNLLDIKSSVSTRSDEQLAVDIMRFMCRLGDGHTWAGVKEQAFGRELSIPVLLNQFEDGLFVTGADEPHRDLVWARVDKLEGLPPEEVLAKLDPIVSCDNSMRLLSLGPWLMRFPGVLKGMDLCRSATELHLTVTDHEGMVRDVTLAPSDPITRVVRTPPGTDNDLPIHIKRRAEAYWFAQLPDSRVMYFQYNACQEVDEKPLDRFAEELFDAIETNDVDALIIDLRWNGGGNLFVSRPLLSRLLQCRKVLKSGSLFVIAGRHTFSAAMVFAAEIERNTPAVFVGEPTGSSPNFVGETNLVTLPYSKMTMSISNLAWQNSHAMDHRTWIAPKIREPMSFEFWRQGRDEAIEAILRFRREQ